mmetsp:Transcript_13431/g.30835  ORF Transcript_13431/g.30835 Transcript_13431/m.30835 type:complete len:344 (+) Transcript_13431:131-1162(+)
MQIVESLGPMLQQSLPPDVYRAMMESTAKSSLEDQKQRLVQLQEQEKVVRAFDKKVMKLEFSQVLPPKPVHEDCAICFCRIPSRLSASIFLPCCGKIICRSCQGQLMGWNDWKCPITPAFGLDDKIYEQKCSFCRQKLILMPRSGDDQSYVRELLEKKVNVGNSRAMLDLAKIYHEGQQISPSRDREADDMIATDVIDVDRAVALYHQAAEECGNGNAFWKLAQFAFEENKVTEYLDFLQNSVEHGCSEAIDKMADLSYRKGMVHYSITLYKYLASIGYGMETPKHLGILHANGILSKRDYDESMQAYKAAKDELFSEDRAAMVAIGGSAGDDRFRTHADDFM